MKCNVTHCKRMGIKIGSFADTPLVYCHKHGGFGWDLIETIEKWKRRRKGD